MRVLFVTNPFRAHLYVQVPLAWALRAAGHEVYVAGPPDLAEDIARTGLPGVTVGPELRLAELMGSALPTDDPIRAVPDDRDHGPCDPRGRTTGRSAQEDFGWGDPSVELEDFTVGVRWAFSPPEVFEDLLRFARSWRPDLVVSDPSAFHGLAVARAVGAASARQLWSVDRVGQLRDACAGRDEDPLRDWLAPFLEEHGVAFDESAVLGDFTLSPSPSWIWQPPGRSYVPLRNMAFNGPATTPGWVLEPPARRRVVITQGISHRDATLSGASPAQALFDAVADLDAEVVATLDESQVAGATLPDNVRVVDFVPFHALLPTASLLAHEGGTGAFATALEHGVPQILVPNDLKVEKWGGPLAMGLGLEAQGAGLYAGNSSTLTPEGLRTAITTVLEDPSFAVNARRVQQEVRGMPTPHDVVPALEKLAHTHAAPGLTAA